MEKTKQGQVTDLALMSVSVINGWNVCVGKGSHLSHIVVKIVNQ